MMCDALLFYCRPLKLFVFVRSKHTEESAFAGVRGEAADAEGTRQVHI